MVLPYSVRVSRVPTYSNSLRLVDHIRDFHPLRSSIPAYSINTSKILGLFPFRSPLLRESRLISFPVGTEMFHFPTFAPRKVTWLAPFRVAPFGNPIDQSFLAAPPGLSQPSTSFIASSESRHPPSALRLI